MDLTNYIPKGNLKGFPIPVIAKMLERQVEQGNIENITVFEKNNFSDKNYNGFSWKQTPEGWDFWYAILQKKELDQFFEKYPIATPKPGDRIMVSSNSSWHNRIFIGFIEGAKFSVITVDLTEEDTFLKGLSFNVSLWSQWQPIPIPQPVKLTAKDISEGKGVGVDPSLIVFVEK